MAAPAPGLFSITTGCLIRFDTPSAAARAMRSFAPPAEKGTTHFTTCSGQSARATWTESERSDAAITASGRRDGDMELLRRRRVPMETNRNYRAKGVDELNCCMAASSHQGYTRFFSERHEDHHLHLPTDQGALGSLWVLPCAGLRAPGNGLRPLRENRGIADRSSISNSQRSPETENLRASCFCNGSDHWEYGDESVEIAVEVASAPCALRAGSALCDARVVDDLRARPR